MPIFIPWWPCVTPEIREWCLWATGVRQFDFLFAICTLPLIEGFNEARAKL